MSDPEICYRSISRIASDLSSGQFSSLALTEMMLERIDRIDPLLKSYILVMSESALADARRADNERADGLSRSPLHGIPVAVKDLCFVRGVPTTAGMPLRQNDRADHDGTVVKRLREAGAVLLGTLAMTEGATFDFHPEVNHSTNPWRADLWPGVSSSGSGVATAAGLCFASIGSDTGGSIRFPSACNGVTGLKPTWGRVSRYGSIANAPSWDTLGVLARSAAEVAMVFDAVGGFDPHDPTSLRLAAPKSFGNLCSNSGTGGLKVGVDRSFLAKTSGEVARSTEAALQVLVDLGVQLREVSVPDTGPLFEYIVDLQLVELAAEHENTYPVLAHRYGPRLREALDRGRSVEPLQVAKGLRERDRFCGTFARLFDEIDLLLMPVLALGTPTWEEAGALLEAGAAGVMYFTGFVNACGIASLTLPCGPTSDGRPVGFQLIGPKCSENVLLRTGHAFQQTTSWHTSHPVL